MCRPWAFSSSRTSAPPHSGCSEALWAPEVEAPAQSSVISIVLDKVSDPMGFTLQLLGGDR